MANKIKLNTLGGIDNLRYSHDGNFIYYDEEREAYGEVKNGKYYLYCLESCNTCTHNNVWFNRECCNCCKKLVSEFDLLHSKHWAEGPEPYCVSCEDKMYVADEKKILYSNILKVLKTNSNTDYTINHLKTILKNIKL